MFYTDLHHLQSANFAVFELRWVELSSWSFYEQFYSMQIWLMFQQFIVLVQSVLFCTRTNFYLNQNIGEFFLMNSFLRETQICIDWQFRGLTKCNTRTHARTYTPNTQWLIDAQWVVDNFSTFLKKQTTFTAVAGNVRLWVMLPLLSFKSTNCNNILLIK